MIGMKLELYINGTFYESMPVHCNVPFKLGVSPTKNFYNKVIHKEESVDVAILQMKAMFYRQINKSRSFEIVLVQGSAMNGRKLPY